MGLFDGLIAKVEGAVTSIEVKAAGLLTSGENLVGIGGDVSPLAPPKVATPYTWQGPLQPGQVRPAAPVAVPVTTGTFNMVADALSKVPGVPAVESFFGFSSPSTAPAAMDYSSESQTWARELVRWDDILASLDKSMNAKDGASDLSAAYHSWASGPYSDAMRQVAALQQEHTSDASAKAVYQNAVAQAQALQKAIQDRWTQFAAQGVPTVSDYVKAPITAVTETGQKIYAAASRAEAAVEKVAGQSVGDLQTFVKYAPWALAAVGVLWVASILPRGRGAN